jgi:hypothetical protein
MPGRVLLIPVFSAGDFRQEARRLVKPDRVGMDAKFPGNIARS